MEDYLYFIILQDKTNKVLLTKRLEISNWYQGEYHEQGVYIPLGNNLVLPFIYSSRDQLSDSEIGTIWQEQSGVALPEGVISRHPHTPRSCSLRLIVPDLAPLVAQLNGKVNGTPDGRRPQGDLVQWIFQCVEAHPASDGILWANQLVVRPLPSALYQLSLGFMFEHLMAAHALSRGLDTADAAPLTPQVSPVLIRRPGEASFLVRRGEDND